MFKAKAKQQKPRTTPVAIAEPAPVKAQSEPTPTRRQMAERTLKTYRDAEERLNALRQRWQVIEVKLQEISTTRQRLLAAIAQGDADASKQLDELESSIRERSREGEGLAILVSDAERDLARSREEWIHAQERAESEARAERIAELRQVAEREGAEFRKTFEIACTTLARFASALDGLSSENDGEQVQRFVEDVLGSPAGAGPIFALTKTGYLTPTGWGRDWNVAIRPLIGRM